MQILMFLWGYRMTILVALAGSVVGFKAGMVVGHIQGVRDGRTAMKVEMMAQSIILKEKLDEIRNVRPNRPGTIRRLRNASF
jgi:hypothetical protein